MRPAVHLAMIAALLLAARAGAQDEDDAPFPAAPASRSPPAAELADRIDWFRAAYGLAAGPYSPALMQVAEAHVQDLA